MSILRTGIPILLALGMALPSPLGAQETSEAHLHMGHVMEGWSDTPEEKGLLPTAIAEAEIALQHARLAANDPNDLAAMQAHAGHVLHALDPESVDGGPGMGYGLIKAAENAATHTRLAAEAEGASGAVKAHATHVRTALGNVTGWAERAHKLALEVRAAGAAAEAAGAVEKLARLEDWIVNGVDANGDGSTGWGEGEGGLAQAERHMRLMYEAEGLALD